MKNAALIILLLLQGIFSSAQKINSIDSLGHFYASSGAGILLFRGDEAYQKLSSGSFSPHISLGFDMHPFNTEFRYLKGSVYWNNNGTRLIDNFKSMINAADLRFFWNKKIQSGANELSLMLGSGLGSISFNSYTDLKDRDGSEYYAWSDGTLRDMPELIINKFSSKILTRDFDYETPLAIKQKAFYIPFSAGIKVKINPKVTSSFCIESMLLRTDQMDRKIIDQKNDKILRVSLSVAWIFNNKVDKKNKPSNPSAPHYDKADFVFLETDDEDLDGVPDIKDLCLNTRSGVIVGQDGCPSDSDQDGIYDHLDKEPNSPKDAWVNRDGISYSDLEIQKMYNDSISWFVSALRKFNKNSRPYPIKKFISAQQYELFARMLENHPEWRIYHEESDRKLPNEFKKVDLNNDQILSVKELEIALNKIFDHAPDCLSPEKLREAIKYAFEVQN